MHKNTILITAAAMAFGLASISSHAMTRKDGLIACAEAMAGDLGKVSNHARAYRLDDRSDLSPLRLSDREMFTLVANNPATGEVVARYDCVVNERARVLRLTELPLGGRLAAKRRAEAE